MGPIKLEPAMLRGDNDGSGKKPPPTPHPKVRNAHQVVARRNVLHVVRFLNPKHVTSAPLLCPRPQTLTGRPRCMPYGFSSRTLKTWDSALGLLSKLAGRGRFAPAWTSPNLASATPWPGFLAPALGPGDIVPLAAPAGPPRRQIPPVESGM